ncbi:MAG TPA: hypothetical protein VKR79_00210 [Gaiellaceae bacterium]|nr:hypothetical protein [Gaiellaceae bacterium]
MKRLALFAGIALAVLVASSTAWAQSSPLDGTFKNTVTPGPGIPVAMDGTWTIIFTAATGTTGTYRFKYHGQKVDGGSYAISGSKVTFTDHWVEGISCKKPGQYTFAAAGNQLTFSVIADGPHQCYPRKVILALSGPLTKA